MPSQRSDLVCHEKPNERATGLLDDIQSTISLASLQSMLLLLCKVGRRSRNLIPFPCQQVANLQKCRVVRDSVSISAAARRALVFDGVLLD